MESKAMVRCELVASSTSIESSLGFQSLDKVPWRAGIPKHWTSDLEKFEGPDPAEWCPRGYAIVNVDSRGVFDSEGDISVLGTQVSMPDLELHWLSSS